ncbi:hypothetical protein C8F01DRAFT_1170031 [Mycena amicta]|nr:hypothetical protein C8F01DRAFT_1170031 [Mycena amicta]
MNSNFLGGIEVSILVAVILLGMVTVQIFVYYSNFSGDSRTIKTLIAIVWLLETAHAGAICYGLYRVTITRYGRLDLPLPLEMVRTVLLGSVVHPLVQAIFTTRIYQLGRNPVNRILTAVCWAMSGFVLGTTVLLSIKVFSVSSLDQFEQQWAWLILGLFATTAMVDLVIAGAMLYYTSRSGQLTDQAVKINNLDTLILWTAQTGLLTGAASVAVLVVFALMKQNHLWLALLVLNTGVYSNSLLSLLNGRLHLGYQAEVPFTISLSTGNMTSIPPAAHLRPLTPLKAPLPPPLSKSSSLGPPSLHLDPARLESPKSQQETV